MLKAGTDGGKMNRGEKAKKVMQQRCSHSGWKKRRLLGFLTASYGISAKLMHLMHF